MRNAFTLLEFIFSLFIIGLIVGMSGTFRDNNSLILARDSLILDLKLTQNLALRDNRFFSLLSSTQLTQSLSPAIDPTQLHSPKTMWQIQFHLKGQYTQNSYSIYIDTPRQSQTTHYDGRPMSGDFIAIEPLNNQCLSGYNNTNISDYCKNNTASYVRLKERFKIDFLSMQGDLFCQEKEGWRIFFDNFGIPYCGKNPKKLIKPLKITLTKNNQSLSICILPKTGFISFCQ